MHPRLRTFRAWIYVGVLGQTLLGTAPITQGATEPDHQVVLTNIEFKPNRLKIKKGDTIRFTNRDKFNHDVYLVRTANRNDVVHAASTLGPGESVTVTVAQEGLFTLYCTIHGGMTAKITTSDTFELTEEEKQRAAARKVIPPVVKVGEALYWGKAQCHRCHMMGQRGTNLRGPNHQDIGFRANARAAKLGLASGTAYIVQSIMDPSATIVEGYSDDMPKVYQAPINLSEDEIKALVAYLQSQGSEVDTWSVNISKVTLASRLPPSPFAKGDPVQGEQVFLDTGCVSCHTAGPHKAISFAPDLTAIGAFRNWTWLVQSITDPNAEIGANWKDATVYLKPGVKPPTGGAFESDQDFDEDESDDEESTGGISDAAKELADARESLQKIRERITLLEARGSTGHATGSGDAGAGTASPSGSSGSGGNAPSTTPSAPPRTQLPKDVRLGASVPGVLRKDSEEEVTLMVAEDRFETFPKDQVAAVVLSRGSRMASNYGTLLTFSQLADLISYLESLKGMPDDASASNGSNP